MQTRGTGRPAISTLALTLVAVFLVAPGFVPRASAQTGVYTGLVIVVASVRVDRSVNPAVLTPTGELVYGRGWWKPGQLNDEFAEQYGIVEYALSVAAANRVGPRPLIVYAVGVTGPPQSTFKTDVVVSDEDALRIHDANTRSRFLQQMRVAIVNQMMAQNLP